MDQKDLTNTGQSTMEELEALRDGKEHPATKKRRDALEAVPNALRLWLASISEDDASRFTLWVVSTPTAELYEILLLIVSRRFQEKIKNWDIPEDEPPLCKGECLGTSLGYCAERNNFFRCTRPKGHDGVHVACGHRHGYHVWVGEEKV